MAHDKVQATSSNAMSTSFSGGRSASPIIGAVRRAATWGMRLGATPVVGAALPVALTLLAGLAMGAIVPTPPCPGITPC